MVAQLTQAPGFDDERIVGSAPVTDNAAFSPPSRKFMITASVAGGVTLTLNDGSTLIVNVAVGDNVYPYAVTKAQASGATVTRYYALY